MFKIGEFSSLTKVSVRMLRYYDEVGIFKPEIIDKFTGYRLYSAIQIPDLQKIILLRDMNFNILEISETLKKWNTQSIVEILENKKNEIYEFISLEQERIKKINTAIKDIYNNKISTHCNLIIKSIPSYNVISLREVIDDYFLEGNLWKKLYSFIESENISLSAGINNIAIFHDNENLNDGVDIEVCAVTKTLKKDKEHFICYETEPIEKAACIMVYGPYINIGKTYEEFAHWLVEHHQYEITGLIRQICHVGPYNEENSEKFLTEVQIPVKLKI